MPQLPADRFVLSGSDWIDLASGAAVRVRVAPAGSLRTQLEWNSRCAALAGLRHPQSVRSSTTAWQAHTARSRRIWACEAIRTDPGTGARLMDHAIRFLAAHDVYLAPEMANYVLRAVIPGARERLRPVGIALQPRRAFDAIHDALATGVPPGASAVAVTGEPNSGLRTLQVAAARTARLEGYVPLAASMLREHRWVARALPGRHVCLFRSDDVREQPAVAEALAHLDAEGARRHVVLSFGRGTSMSPVVQVERMGIIAMTEMVYVDVEHGPRPDSALRCGPAFERPAGEFLVRLGASDPGGARVSFMVHESVQPYDVPSRGDSIPVPLQAPRAMPGVLHRAPERGEALARAGRHGAARRLLHRALHVLAERGETCHAAACALQLGWLAVERAQLAEALRYFGRARDLSTHARTIVLAGIGIGVVWTDEGRLVEAEGALRTAALAAKTLDDPILAAGADAALGRCLFWQGRHDEAATVPGSLRLRRWRRANWRVPAWRWPASSWPKDRRSRPRERRGKRWNARRKRAMQPCWRGPIELWPTRPPPVATRHPRPATLRRGWVLRRAHICPCMSPGCGSRRSRSRQAPPRLPTTAGSLPGSPRHRSTGRRYCDMRHEPRERE